MTGWVELWPMSGRVSGTPGSFAQCGGQRWAMLWVVVGCCGALPCAQQQHCGGHTIASQHCSQRLKHIFPVDIRWWIVNPLTLVLIFLSQARAIQRVIVHSCLSASILVQSDFEETFYVFCGGRRCLFWWKYKSLHFVLELWALFHFQFH